MTPHERALVARFRRKLAELYPDIAAALMGAWDDIQGLIDVPALARSLEAGDPESLAREFLSDQLLDTALAKVRYQLRLQLEKSVAWSVKDLPRKAIADAAIGFDILNPRHIDAIRSLNTRVMNGLKDDARAAVRAAIEEGLKSGTGPREIARGLREIVGLAENQVRYIANLEAALKSGNIAKARTYKLLDKRFNLNDLNPEKIDRIVSAYRKSWTMLHAETVSRTATIDTLRNGQKLAWDQAIADGIIDGNRLQKTWVQVDRPTKRESHALMNGETVPHDAHFSNGDYLPGDGDPWNCACIARYTMRRDSQRAAA